MVEKREAETADKEPQGAKDRGAARGSAKTDRGKEKNPEPTPAGDMTFAEALEEDSKDETGGSQLKHQPNESQDKEGEGRSKETQSKESKSKETQFKKSLSKEVQSKESFQSKESVQFKESEAKESEAQSKEDQSIEGGSKGNAPGQSPVVSSQASTTVDYPDIQSNPPNEEDAARCRDKEVAAQASGMRWAPLQVPFKRRLQTAAVLMHSLCIGLSLSIFFSCCAIPFFWPISRFYRQPSAVLPLAPY